ncbi:TolB family protein [Dictyobacter aurantiacus]|nr:PD40 domain-containing protein [Dictyobacter aurantiacus]
MKKYPPWKLIILFALLSMSLQGCLGLGGGDTDYKSVTTGKNGDVKINSQQAVFQGKIYFTLNRNLYMLDGKNKEHLMQLTKGMDVRDPAVSPNGKLIAFIIHYKDYSDLAYMPASGGKPTIIATGYGKFTPNGASVLSTYHWFAQPAWDPDNEHIYFLGDNQKHYWNPALVGNYDADILDLQVFKMSIHDKELVTVDDMENAQAVAYTSIGAGGLRDPAYRPGHANELVYTSYKYTPPDWSKLAIQINIIDTNAIQNSIKQDANPYNPKYHPGVYASEYDPGVSLTPEKADLTNMQPAFSPDGNTLIYVRREDATHMSLYTMPVVNGVTSDPNNPAFDPNSDANTKKGLSGYAQSTKLMTGQYISQPVWSPDGSQIVYYDYHDNLFDLWLAKIVKDPKTGAYSIDKNSITQLTQTNGNLDADSRAAWSR